MQEEWDALKARAKEADAIGIFDPSIGPAAVKLLKKQSSPFPVEVTIQWQEPCSFCGDTEIRMFCCWPGLLIQACASEVCFVKYMEAQEEYMLRMKNQNSTEPVKKEEGTLEIWAENKHVLLK